MMNDDLAYLQTWEQWTRFFSALVHQLRTPFASIRMLADLLAEAPQSHLGDQERRYSEHIQDVVQDLQALVGDVGELVRLMTSGVQIRPEEIGLEKLVNEVDAVVRPRAWEGGIALTNCLAFALPAFFRADRDRLRKVLVLLLSAAVSHAKSEVLFRLDMDAIGLRATISSDGLPIPEGTSQVLFEPFHESVRIFTQRGNSSLSLPLAHELARALGGVLCAENREGKPVFDLSLPAAG